MKNLRRTAVSAVAVGMMLAAWSVGTGQQGGGGRGVGQLGGSSMGAQDASQIAPPSSSVPSVVPDIAIPPQMESDQAKMRNVERQKQLVEETQKLLSLANELKADVDKSNKDMLSLEVVRKADEIEKLAHNVKEKMKNGS